MKNVDPNTDGLAPATNAMQLLFTEGLAKVRAGQLYNTRGACHRTHPANAATALTRHVRGEWGELDPEDATLQNVALRGGQGDSGRFMSVWTTNLPWKGYQRVTFWIITEGRGAQRHTTLLLPEEY